MDTSARNMENRSARSRRSTTDDRSSSRRGRGIGLSKSSDALYGLQHHHGHNGPPRRANSSSIPTYADMYGKSSSNNRGGGGGGSGSGRYKDEDEDDPENSNSTRGQDNGDEEEEEEPSFMKAIRRGSMSKEESQQALQQRLSLVSGVSNYEETGSNTNLEALKAQFAPRNLKPKNSGRMMRRSSISSVNSQRSTFSERSHSEYGSSSLVVPNSMHGGTAVGDDMSGHVSNYSMDFGEIGLGSSVSGTPQSKPSTLFLHNESAATLRVDNLRALHPGTPASKNKKGGNHTKTDQIVESLVWFSFHTPRAILEDLIAHEMDVWRREHLGITTSTHSRKSSQKGNLSGRLSSHSHSKRSGTSGGIPGGSPPLSARKPGKNKKSLAAVVDRNEDDEGGSGGSLSSLSEDGGEEANTSNFEFERNFPDAMMHLQQSNGDNMVHLPKSVERDCALLFVDMSGFTKLSTMLDVESLSKVINSYFDMIVSEVIQHGGDILKFAGDAFFAEWKIVEDPEEKASTPLSELNASLASMNDLDWDDDGVPKLSSCVLQAAKCAISIVEKFSDYHVTSAAGSTDEAVLNVHCGLGVGHMVGLHVGDYKEDQEEEAMELRREFLILGDPIDQVAKAADVATDGQVMASPEAMMALSVCCDIVYAGSNQPMCIAMRDKNFLNLSGKGNAEANALQPYESLRMHCKALGEKALLRLHLQMALYVHPVIRGDELALSSAIQSGKISQPTETVESRHRAEAELRSVFTIFVKVIMSAKVTGVPEIDTELYEKLGNVMHVVSRELDRYSGHLRQFIVDDKGIVLIATFGLRGSTFPNMVSNNGLPAVFAIHHTLKNECKVENRVGATFGKVYCGVVGGVRRHEFAVMGAPVNLAARLMASKVNNGILVDEAVKSQDTDGRYEFKSLPPVKAKGYSKLVPILEPKEARSTARKKKSSFPFTGRTEEKKHIISAAKTILNDPIESNSSMVFLMGESGMGKTALALSVIDDIRKVAVEEEKTIVAARSTSNETEQKIPLSSYRKIFSCIIRDLCEFDGTAVPENFNQSGASTEDKGFMSNASLRGSAIQSLHSAVRGKRRSLGLADRILEEENEATSSPIPQSDVLSRDEWELLTPMKEDDRTVNTLNKSLRDVALDLAKTPSTSTREHSRHAPLSASLHGEFTGHGKRKLLKADLGSSVHRLTLGRSSSVALRMSSPQKAQSVRNNRSTQSSHHIHNSTHDERSNHSMDSKEPKKDETGLPYFEKLCWVCEQLNYPYEFADIVGSQFLGLDGANPVTQIDGHVPTMDELVEFLGLAFICLAEFADLTVVLIDDFQWVDSFSWKIFRVLVKRGKKLLLLCAMRSHDKQAMRRLSTAATKQVELQNHMVEISLLPLDVPDIKVLVSRVLGYNKKLVPDSLCVDVFQRSGGLPVYVVQMLEDMKRRKTVEIGKKGVLEWTALGLKEKRTASNNSSGAVMEETFLSRFDGLDVRVRKILQTCAVLGLSFALSDVIQVHPEMTEMEIEAAIDVAVDEMILVEQIEDKEGDDDASSKSSKSDASSNSEISDSNTQTFTFDRTASTDNLAAANDRYFQFSHAMWRKNVLTTMLKERKVELHRLIADSMENNQILNIEESDISRLLTLFEHWKQCGDFEKSAPLAILVGSRLEDWDLSAQSLELYEDALQMSFESVNTTEDNPGSEWISVSAKPAVLDLILRLHVRVGLCHRRLGDDEESLAAFEDAYKIIKTASKIPTASKELMMPILSSLCVLKTNKPCDNPHTRAKIENLLDKFIDEAKRSKKPVFLGRAMSIQAQFFAKNGKMEKAVRVCEKMCQVYNVAKHSGEMQIEYGQDSVVECLADSVQWYYLIEKHEQAEEQADIVIEKYLPLIDSSNTDSCMKVVLPMLQVLRLVNRAKDADWLLKRYIINPAHDHPDNSEFWIPLFNPLAYVIELIVMEEEEEYDAVTLKDLEDWVLAEENVEFDYELERKAHTLMGEICWRLANFHDEGSERRNALERTGKRLLMPVAQYPHDEVFLRRTAIAIMEAF